MSSTTHETKTQHEPVAPSPNDHGGWDPSDLPGADTRGNHAQAADSSESDAQPNGQDRTRP